jgi:hypothetical protein
MSKVYARLRYLKSDVSRHGQVRLYVRLPGKKNLIRLPVDSVEDPRFGPAYAAALKGETIADSDPRPRPAAAKPIPGSLRALCVRYFEFLTQETQLTAGTKYTRRKHLEDVCREPLKTGSDRVMGDCPLDKFSSAHVQVILDRKRAHPEASNGRRKALLALFNWAIPRHLAASNPAAAGAALLHGPAALRRHPLRPPAPQGWGAVFCAAKKREAHPSSDAHRDPPGAPGGAGPRTEGSAHVSRHPPKQTVHCCRFR